MIIDLESYGYDDEWREVFLNEAPAGSEPARVLRHDGIAVMVVRPGGIEQVHVRRNEKVTTGDWVAVDDNVVTAVLPRRTSLRRRDPRADIEQMLAANVDVVMIVCALDRELNAGLVRRALTLVADSGAEPCLVLTKTDMAEDAGIVDELTAEHPGVRLIMVSSVDGQGLDEIRRTLSGRTGVLLGESGAGKSTLTNALLGTDEIEVGDVREKDAAGRHTTSSRQLHLLPDGGILIDNPGIRSLGLMGLEEETVEDTFDDVSSVAEECRFTDCGHQKEPGCAVNAAVAAGELQRERVEAWRSLQADVADAAQREREHTYLQKGRRTKRR